MCLSFFGVLLELFWSFVCPELARGRRYAPPGRHPEVSLPGARGPGEGRLLPLGGTPKRVCPGQEGCSPWEAPQSESARGREAQGPEVALRPKGDGFGAGGSRCQDSWSLMGPGAPQAPGLRYQVPGPRPGLSSRAQGAGEVAPIDRDGLQYQKNSAHDGPVMRHA